MDDVQEMILRDVRCFEGEQRGSVRPITLLVGENSTGKSTFLGCYCALDRLLSSVRLRLRMKMRLDGWLDFNQPPFLLGAFQDIVRSGRGRHGRIDQFQIGFVLPPMDGDGDLSCEFLVTFSERGSEPAVSSFCWRFDAESFLEIKGGEENETIVRVPNYEAKIDLPFEDAEVAVNALIDIDYAASWNPDLRPIIDYLDTLLPVRPDDADLLRRKRFSELLPNLPGLIPIAPLRSKPVRTYDPVRESASPDGEHVPMLMMRLDHAAESRWDELHNDLVEFGKQSGLFSDIKVKRHGREMSDPFQLQVKVRSGSHMNVMDVGYGVSQSLPILVDIMAPDERYRELRMFPRRRRRGLRTFLLQQPEIHLHPRGQAELASFFVESFNRRGNHFLIETHSDYIVDRVRICVRKGILKADDVSILYFEPKRNAVNIHSMTLDKEGNLDGAPPGYRDFFARETDRLLGFSD